MKTCPKCNRVFTPDNIYCLNDGTVLVTEDFALPSTFDSEEETVVRSAPPPVQDFSAPQPAPKRSASRSFLYLIVGLILGAGLVLGGLFLIAVRFGEMNIGVNSTVNTKTTANVTVVSQKHVGRNKTRDDNEFNGLVDTENANLRAAPNSGVQDVLPKNDRINIIERENPTSPWYRVICEHGVTGWMHGNTIKFSGDSEAF